MKSSLFGLSVLLVVATGTPALAQYRDGQPPVVGDGTETYRSGQPQVLAPPPPMPGPGVYIRERFQRAYMRAKAPRIVIFWNREFTDEVATRYERYARIRSRTVSAAAGVGATAFGPGVVVSSGAGVAASSSDVEIRTGADRVSDNRTGSFHYKAYDFDIEQGFSRELGGAGVKLVDRTTIMRTTGAARGAGETANLQALETQAILARADIVIEVVQMLDPRKPDGIAYRVIVRNVRAAKTLASLSTSGIPPAQKMPLVSGPRGWERAVAPEPGPDDIGRQIAIETMSALSATL